MSERNISISGSGSCAGGEYHKVSISGSGKVNGDIICTKFSSSGSSKIEGSIRCEQFGINGTSKVTGNVQGTKVSINGTCKIEGNLLGDEVKICGTASVGNAIKGEHIGVYGTAKVGGDIEGEEVHIMGGMKHEKCINAERVRIESKSSGGRVEFNEIGATEVWINQDPDERLWKRFVGLFMLNGGRTVGELIEADKIVMDYASVGTLRGHDIVIGGACDIALVEYSGTLTISEHAQVKETRKIER